MADFWQVTRVPPRAVLMEHPPCAGVSWPPGVLPELAANTELWILLSAH